MNLRELFPGSFNIKVVVLGQTSEHVVIKQRASIPAANSAFRDRGFWVLNHSVNIKELVHAQTITGGAGAGWIVKRE